MSLRTVAWEEVFLVCRTNPESINAWRRKITSKQSRESSNRRSNDLLACGYCNSYKGKYAMRFIQSSGSDISHILSKLSIALLISVLCNTIISPELV
jgi:hypothetical protein